MEKIKEGQKINPYLNKIRKEIEEGKRTNFEMSNFVKFSGRIFILANEEIKKLVMNETYATSYIIHIGSTKIYQDL